MKSITIQGQKRESVGKRATKALRNADHVPCVVYGENEPIHFSTEEKNFKPLVYTPEAHTVILSLDSGQNLNAILQDVQFHPVTDKILHADFYMLNDNKDVSMDVPVILTGRAKGVMVGGNLRLNMRKLTVRALPAKLPDNITIDVTPMQVGAKIYVESLRNNDYTILHPDNAVVVAIKRSRTSMANAGMADDEAEEAPAPNNSETTEPTE